MTMTTTTRGSGSTDDPAVDPIRRYNDLVVRFTAYGAKHVVVVGHPAVGSERVQRDDGPRDDPGCVTVRVSRIDGDDVTDEQRVVRALLTFVLNDLSRRGEVLDLDIGEITRIVQSVPVADGAVGEFRIVRDGVTYAHSRSKSLALRVADALNAETDARLSEDDGGPG